MPKAPAAPFDFYTNTGGMITINSGIRVPLGSALNAINVNLTPIGGFSSRNGYTILNSTAFNSGAIMTGLYDAAYSSGTNVLIGTGGNKIQKMDSLDGTWDDLTGALTLTAGENNLYSFAMLNDIVVCANDVDNCIQVSSALSASSIGAGTFTSALFCVEYRGYMFYGNTVESAVREPDRLRFSNNNVPGTLTSTDTILVHKKQGGQLRGAIVYRDRLLCFKENGLYEILFQPTRVASDGTVFPFIQNPNPLIIGVGAQSHRTLIHFSTPPTHKAPDDYIFFVDQYGMPRIYAGGNFALPVGYPISKSRDTAILCLSDMVHSVAALRSQYAINYPERSQIWVFQSDSSQMDTCWCLDYSTEWAWSRHSFPEAFTCGALVRHTDGTFRVFTGNRTGTTYRHDTTVLDNATAISWSYLTGDIFKSSVAIKSNWPLFEVRGSSGSDSQSINISFGKDGEDIPTSQATVVLYSTQTKWAQFKWAQAKWAKKGLITRTVEPNLDAKTVRTRFSDVVGSQATVEGWTHFPITQGTANE